MSAAEKPNVILIMTDQQRGDCLGLEGHPVLLTPNMDAIGGQGARFSHAYTTCPVCVPARRSLLTGQFPSTHGVLSNAGIEWDTADSLVGTLTRAGYQTGWVGRSMHQTPVRKRYGFESMVFGDHRTEDDYDEWMSRAQPPGGGGYRGAGVMHNDWTARPWHMEEALHHTNWTVNEALRFLTRRDPSCPFFLVVSFIAPHPPLIPPAFYFDRYLRQELPPPVIGDWAQPPPNGGVGQEVSSTRVNLTGELLRSARAGYYGLINHVDDQIRRLLNSVTGLRRNDAVVIHTSDHGEMLGDHYLWRKSLPYEGAARIPLLIQAPECFGFPAGLTVDRPVGLEDVLPTVLDLAGLPIPAAADGESLVPLLRGEDAPWREWLHVETAPTYHCLTDGREKYIWFVADGREQFFDLASDPTECRDLAGDAGAAERVAEWRSRMVCELASRPEGFSDGERLVPGRPYRGIMPGVKPV